MSSATTDQPRAMEQSFRALWLLYGIVPIVAGADKFVGLLANWENYIAPAFRGMLPVSPTTFMHAVGIIEIVAGILVFALPRVGAWVVTAWLLCIATNLAVGGFFDIAIRDVGLAVGAGVLGRLALARTEPVIETRRATT
jgi:uncharacterized membrane protein YphA (DoxX/SURF4 family)